MNIPEQLGWVKLEHEDGYWIPRRDRDKLRALGGGRLIATDSMVLELETIPVHRIPQILAGGEAFPRSFHWHQVVLLRSWREEVILPYLRMRML